MTLEVIIKYMDDFPEPLHPHFEARKRLFVDELQWDLPDYDGSDLEIDSFDGPYTRYCYFKVDGALVYSMRLLEGSQSMLRQLWRPAHLALNAPEPSIEMSRFVAHGQTPSLQTTRLLGRMVLNTLREYGYSSVTGTMDHRIMRLYKILNNFPMQEVAIDENTRAGFWKL